jgi:hypothetical protein
MRRVALILTFLASTSALPGPAVAVPRAAAPNCRVFPDNNVWHAKVTGLPVHRRSKQWIRAMGGKGQLLHPDFGPSDDPEHPYGIPYNVVDGSAPRSTVDFYYAAESDPGPYPVAADTHVEHGSDRHALIIDRDACVLYEIFDFDGTAATRREGRAPSGTSIRTRSVPGRGPPPTRRRSRSSPG